MTMKLLYSIIAGLACACTKEKQSSSAILTADSIVPVAGSISNTAAPELSAPMKRALDAYAPGFQLFTVSNFTTQVVSYSQPPTNEPLNRAAGDFNGDGVPDLALYGHDNSREMILVLLSVPDKTYKVFPLKEQQALPRQAHDLSVYITAAQPGPLEIPEGLTGLDTPPPPKTLPHGGVNIIYDGQAGELFYWNGSRFVLVTTGD